MGLITKAGRINIVKQRQSGATAGLEPLFNLKSTTIKR